MRKSLSRATGLAVLALAALVAAGCSSAQTADTASKPAPQLVSATQIAEHLRLDRHLVDERGRISLTEPVDGGEIVIYAESTVVTVNGTMFTTMAPIALKNGEGWLTSDDAAAVESIWRSSVAFEPTPWTAPVLLPLPPSPSSVGPTSAPSGRGQYADQASASEKRAWGVSLRREWRYIVIHHSATQDGSAAQFDAFHRKTKGWDGLGYDFVIGNGTGSGDGQVEVGYRWTEQKVGAHAGPNNPRNRDGIGICLVGDFTKTRPTASQMRSLARLCNFLSAYCGIPRENFLLHGDVRGTSCPGPMFPRDFVSPSRRVAATNPRSDDFAGK